MPVTNTPNPRIDWDTPAGRALKRLAGALPPDRFFHINVFGSAPLQMMIDATLLSADVDVFAAEDDLKSIVKAHGLDQPIDDIYIQVCERVNFRTTPAWHERATVVSIERCSFTFPQPIDILIGKLNRLDEKDILAFKTVIAKTGHPTEQELIRELQSALDLFRPNFDEESPSNMLANTQELWRILFKREIDVRQEIIRPALKRLKEGYGEPARDYKKELGS